MSHADRQSRSYFLGKNNPTTTDDEIMGDEESERMSTVDEDETTMSIDEDETENFKLNQENRRQVRDWFEKKFDNVKDVKCVSRNQIQVQMEEVASIYSFVAHPREAVKDAQVLDGIAVIEQHHTKHVLQGSRKFNADEFANKLMNFCHNNDEVQMIENDVELAGRLGMLEDSWKKIGHKFGPYLRIPTPFSYIHGAFKPGPPPPKPTKERKPRIKNEKSKAIVLQAAERNAADSTSEDTVKAQVERIRALLRKHCGEAGGRIQYFQFVLHPSNFGRSVENMFYVSFLIHDNFVKLSLDENQLPCLQLTVMSEREEWQENSATANQCILSITLPQYQELVQRLHINEPMIPDREN